jgi:predicted lipoprotein with Yx(FWY)xxD motif
MRYRVLTASAVFGTFLLTACGSATAPGSAYSGAETATVMSGTSPAASASASGPASGMSAASAVLTVRKTPIGYVLANVNGYTVYWFARDRRGGSHPACAGSCLLAWFPVKGQPAPADGTTLAGKLGCITRPGGVMQATYNGYPLYTFGSDSAPGMTNGNGSGGAWHVIREKAPAATAAAGPGY